MLAQLGGDAGQRLQLAVAGAVLILTLALSAALGAMGRLPVGSDHSAYTGVRELATELRALPDDSVLYYHSLGWHYDYYLFDAPQDRRWWDSAWKLAGDAAKAAIAEPQRQQWVILPAADAHELENLRPALLARGLALASRGEPPQSAPPGDSSVSDQTSRRSARPVSHTANAEGAKATRRHWLDALAWMGLAAATLATLWPLVSPIACWPALMR